MEAKTTEYHSIQAAEATCSKAICDAKAQTTSQATMFQGGTLQLPAGPRRASPREGK